MSNASISITAIRMYRYLAQVSEVREKTRYRLECDVRNTGPDGARASEYRIEWSYSYTLTSPVWLPALADTVPSATETKNINSNATVPLGNARWDVPDTSDTAPGARHASLTSAVIRPPTTGSDRVAANYYRESDGIPRTEHPGAKVRDIVIVGA